MIRGDLTHAFHMGTALKEGKIVTNGGRVLFVIGKGDSFKEAKENAYMNVDSIKCDDLFYRHDIGYQVLEKEKTND